MKNNRFLVVFDIEGTLLEQIDEKDNKNKLLINQGRFPEFVIKSSCIYMRPDLNSLIYFLIEHKIEYGFWSTSKVRNMKILEKILYKIGFIKPAFSFSYNECFVGIKKVIKGKNKTVKDLTVVSNNFGYDLSKIILIDDDLYNSVYNQNFFCCKKYLAENDDIEILKICKILDKIIDCKETCGIKILI